MPYTTSCVFCGSIHKKVLDLGLHPHSDYFPSSTKYKITCFPLNLVRCTKCGLYQIDYHLDKEFLFNENYIYDSSINIGGVKHWEEFAKTTKEIFSNKINNLSHLDIGSNAGELNEAFSRLGFNSIGIEPSKDPYKKAITLGRKSINSYFDRSLLDKLPLEKFNLITFTNSFPHIPNPYETLRLASELLEKENGVIVIESPAAKMMIENFQYDQIYHQHMTYLDFKPLDMLANELNLEIHNLVNTDFHNGSTRYYISFKNVYKKSSHVEEMFANSSKKSIDLNQQDDSFRRGCLKKRDKLKKLINQYKDENKKICCVSAPAKGNTILNYCNLNCNDIPFTTEANILKVGRYTPLSSLPIKEDSYLSEYKPDAIIILAWNFFDEISNAIKKYVPSTKMYMPL